MKKIYIFILLLFSSVGAFAQYVLKASDVTVSSSGLIESCNISDFNKPSYGSGNVVIPESINNITITGIKGHRLGGAFFNKGITGLTLPDGVVSIGVKAFANNTIASINIPYGNVNISAGAFQNNALTSVTIPSTTENIFQFAFDGNSALNGITLPVCNSVSGKVFTVWHDANGKVYNGGETVTDFTIAYRAQFVNSIPYTLTDADVTILNGIITVCSNTNGGTDITIPNTIKNQEVVKIAANVFYGKGVDKVVLPVLDDDFFTGWLSGTGINYAGGAVIKDLTTSYTAQFAMSVIYTLTDPDVTVQHGVIKTCSIVNGANVIRIPEKLQNQDVLGINANVFKDKGVVRLILPSPTIDNFLHWRSGTGDTYVAGATVNDVLTSYNIEYDQTKPYTLQDKDVVMYGDGILKEVVYNFSCKNIIIPDRLHGMDVKVISEASNFENKGITSLQLPGTLEEIEDYVFTDNEIESLILPEKYFKMGIAVFTNNKISKINGKASDGIIFARKSDGTEDFTTIISYGGSSDIVDFIPNTVININTVAFNGCGITSVKLPENLLFIGEWAFEGNSINYINLPGTKEWIDNSGIIYPAGSQISNYQKAYTHNVHYTLADADVVVKEGNIVGFTNTKGATFITIPDKLHGEHIIGVRSGVFVNKGVVKLFLPKHNNLPDFRGWTNFLAETIKPINGQYIISNFSAPEIDGKNLNKTYIAKLSSYTLTSMDVEMENNVLKSSVFKFLVNKSIDYSNDPPTFIYDTLDIPRHLIIPDNLDGQSVEHIGREVFMNGGLDKLDLPSSLISTGEYSFASNNIELLTIPANVLTIGEWSFANDYSIVANKGLRRLEFENGSKLKEISRYAFYGNYKLDQFLYLSDKVEVICDYAFSESGVDFVKFPKTIQEIGKGAFKGCDIRGANYLVFPDDCSIEMIGEEAFADNIPLDADGGIILPKSNINGFIGWRSNQTNEILGAGSKISNLSTSYRAQYEYTLSDDDVEMEDGYIKNYIRDLDKCSSYIVIPDILEGQEVKGIKVRYGYPPGALCLISVD
ncbi:MAG: leucine-rich repeat domain-containing protein [Bacteroidales bacterium]|jgi:hypothetical protein|nr:leucine-rich repeat domain-containing protein [Bacteroidales bacterium]